MNGRRLPGIAFAVSAALEVVDAPGSLHGDAGRDGRSVITLDGASGSQPLACRAFGGDGSRALDLHFPWRAAAAWEWATTCRSAFSGKGRRAGHGCLAR